MGRAKHQHPADQAAVQHFTRDHPRLDRLADPDIVGNQKANRIELESQDKWHELIGPRPKRQPTGASERRRAAAQQQARRVEQDAAGGGVANNLRVGTGKRCLGHPGSFEREKQADRVRIASGNRLEVKNLGRR